VQQILESAGFPAEVIVLDFETYFDKDYTFNKSSTVEFVMDSRFEVMGLGYEFVDRGVRDFLTPDEIRPFIQTLPGNQYTMVAQNAPFDLLVLRERYGVTPKYTVDILDLARHLDARDRHDLDHLARKYHAPTPKGDTMQFQGLHWANMTETQRGNLRDYCLNDVDIEVYLFKTLLPRITRPEIELRLAAQTLRQYLVPRIKVDTDLGGRLIAGMQAKLQKPVDAVNALGVRVVTPPKRTRAGLVPPTVKVVTVADVSKDSVFLSLLKLALPASESIPMKSGKRGLIPALAKTDTQCDYLLSHPEPRVRALMEARKASDSWPTHISRVRKLLAQAAARGGYMGVPLVYYGAHCTTGDVEVLTRNGWKRLDSWRGGDIACWSPCGVGIIQFLPATRTRIMVYEMMSRLQSPELSVLFTKGHNQPFFTHRGIFKTGPVGDHQRMDALPLAGHLNQNYLPDAECRLLVAVQADGHWICDKSKGRCLRFGFRRERKIARIRQLLSVVGIPWSEYTESCGTTRIRIRWADCPTWLTPERKLFGSWLLRYNPATVVDELSHWDGHRPKNSAGIEYSTCQIQNAEWVQIVAHLCGNRAHITKRERNNTRWNPSFRVFISKESTTHVQPEHWSTEYYSGYVYCPRTWTGYWLARSKGRVFITGNTGRWSGAGGVNFQNFGARDVDPLVKQVGQMLTAPDGYVLGTGDLSQIEARVVAWFAGQNDLLETFAQGRDVYSEFGTEQIYHAEVRKPRKDDPPELARILKIRRDLSKETVLGAGFGMGGNTHYERCKVKPSLRDAFASGELNIQLCNRAIAVYRQRFNRIPVFWCEVEKAWRFVARYRDQRATVSHYGRTLRFWNEDGTVCIGLPSGRVLFYPHAAVGPDSTCRYRWGHLWGGAIVENIVQATARDYFAEGLLRLEDADFPVLMSVHDQAVVLISDDNNAETRLAEMHKLQIINPVWAEGLPTATEGDLSERYHKT